MAEWTVAIANWNMQHIANQRLRGQGFECYFPMFRELIVRGNQKVYRVGYLFGSYFFVVMAENWRAISSTKGVAKLLTIGDTISTVHQAIIDELHRREDHLGYVRIAPHHKRRFSIGQDVRVQYGPMAGLSAIVAGMSGTDRVRVLLDMLGRQTSATMHQDQLVAA